MQPRGVLNSDGIAVLDAPEKSTYRAAVDKAMDVYRETHPVNDNIQDYTKFSTKALVEEDFGNTGKYNEIAELLGRHSSGLLTDAPVNAGYMSKEDFFKHEQMQPKHLKGWYPNYHKDITNALDKLKTSPYKYVTSTDAG